MKQIRTALVRTEIDKHQVIQSSEYNTQKDFATTLRSNSYKVLKIWNGYITEEEAREWRFLNRNPREVKETVDSKEKATNAEFDTAVRQTINSKPFSACFCTFDGDEDDVTSSFDTESKDFATVKEAYDACMKFKSECCGYYFAGCRVEDEQFNWIYDCGSEGQETYRIDGKRVEFDAFNAKYHVYTPKFTVEIDELFTELENAVYSAQQVRYFKGEEDEADLSLG